MSTGYINLPVEGGAGGAAWGDITGTLSSQADLQTALDGKLNTPTTGVGFWSRMPTFPTVLNYFVLETDFTAAATAFLVSQPAGAGAVTQGDDVGVNATEKCWGVIKGQTGTTTTGSVIMWTGLGQIFPGQQASRYGNRAMLQALSDGTESFVIYMGHMDSAFVNPTNGVFFRYTHSVNGGRWEAVCRAAGVETATDTTIAPVANVYDVFEIEINTAWTSATFYINGTLRATITTNIPTAALGLGFGIRKTAGTTNRNLNSDAFYIATERLASR